jgi:hypothetical protein
MTNTTSTLPQTQQELFKALVELHTQANAVKDDIKTLKSDLSEAGSELDFAGISKVAAKAASYKTAEAQADAEAFIELIKELT